MLAGGARGRYGIWAVPTQCEFEILCFLVAGACHQHEASKGELLFWRFAFNMFPAFADFGDLGELQWAKFLNPNVGDYVVVLW